MLLQALIPRKWKGFVSQGFKLPKSGVRFFPPLFKVRFIPDHDRRDAGFRRGEERLPDEPRIEGRAAREDNRDEIDIGRELLGPPFVTPEEEARAGKHFLDRHNAARRF